MKYHECYLAIIENKDMQIMRCKRYECFRQKKHVKKIKTRCHVRYKSKFRNWLMFSTSECPRLVTESHIFGESYRLISKYNILPYNVSENTRHLRINIFRNDATKESLICADGRNFSRRVYIDARVWKIE